MDIQDLSKVHHHIPPLTAQLQARAIGRREFLRTSTLLGLSATAAYWLAGCITGTGTISRAAAAKPTRGGTVRFVMPISDTSDPHAESWINNANVIRQVNEQLVRMGPDNIARPWLLESWHASRDLRTWMLTLRKGIRWHDGEELSADQVVWNIERWLDPSVRSTVAGLMKGFILNDSMRLWSSNAIEVLDRRTLRLNLKSPLLAVPEYLSHFPAIILHPRESGRWGPGAVGTGPFTLLDIKKGDRAVLEARRDYWALGPFVDRVEFVDLGDDSSANLRALSSKQVLGVWTFDISDYNAYRALSHVHLHEVPTAQTAVARFKPRGPFVDARVRKAMRLAIDSRQCLQDAHRGLGLPGEHHHVCPVHPEYAKLPFMNRDVHAAKRLLSEAGYPNGFSTEIKCKSTPTWEAAAVKSMVEMWRDAGIKVSITAVRLTERCWL